MTNIFLVIGYQVESECIQTPLNLNSHQSRNHVKAVSIHCLHPTQYVQTTFSSSNLPLIHSHSYLFSVLNCIPRAPTLQLVALLSLLWTYQLAWCCIAQFNHPNSCCRKRQGYFSTSTLSGCLIPLPSFGTQLNEKQDSFKWAGSSSEINTRRLLRSGESVCGELYNRYSLMTFIFSVKYYDRAAKSLCNDGFN